MQKKLILALFLIFFSGFVFAGTQDANSTSYKVWIGYASGEDANSSSYKIKTIVGQPVDANRLQSTSYNLFPGFFGSHFYTVASVPGSGSRGNPLCGNFVCERENFETSATCPKDCSAICGDNACTRDETIDSCPVDCSTICGDGICYDPKGETSLTCPVDCGLPVAKDEEKISEKTIKHDFLNNVSQEVLAKAGLKDKIDVSSKFTLNKSLLVVRNSENKIVSKLIFKVTPLQGVQGLRLLIDIPKSFAQNANENSFPQNLTYNILVADPLIEVKKDLINEEEFVLSVEKEVTEAVLGQIKIAAVVDELIEIKACRLDVECDDSNPCTNNVCGLDKCLYTALPNGTSCGFQQVCSSGTCVQSQSPITQESKSGNLFDFLGGNLTGLIVIGLIIVILLGIYFGTKETPEQKIARLRGKGKNK
ncbi:MAG: hypothetical protein Q7K42_05665 [Candidatus Diapherotrites archaeon]|nr:hypothetical protein [Candidatus Diapherotrites archaeon]